MSGSTERRGDRLQWGILGTGRIARAFASALQVSQDEKRGRRWSQLLCLNLLPYAAKAAWT